MQGDAHRTRDRAEPVKGLRNPSTRSRKMPKLPFSRVLFESACHSSHSPLDRCVASLAASPFIPLHSRSHTTQARTTHSLSLSATMAASSSLFGTKAIQAILTNKKSWADSQNTHNSTQLMSPTRETAVESRAHALLRRSCGLRLQ